ncbi:chorismate mutase [Streptomyces malaysiensis]|uniref:chorismate mutase n=1 Tax=Streptomyces malaysiensis TaxID=92644 RepID=UPI002B29E227|nr:chorismate mutase [Streptomyces malaysiensis]
MERSLSAQGVRPRKGKQLNLRNRTARRTSVVALLAAAISLTASQAMAADVETNAASSNSAVKTAKPLGRLGSLTDLTIDRLLVSDDVAASKFGTDSPIDDPAREQQVLEQVQEQADALGLNPDTAVAFFQDQITASKTVQRGLFARWTAHPDEAPTERPDLGQIRTRLDQLTKDLLQELKATEGLRAKPIACAAQLALATGTGTILERLDTLHRQVLRTATHSVCVNPVK